MIYKIFGNAISANNGQAGQDKKLGASLVGGVANDVRQEIVVPTRQSEATGFGSYLCWALAKYHGDCRGMIDAGRFNAMAVNGDNLVV